MHAHIHFPFVNCGSSRSTLTLADINWEIKGRAKILTYRMLLASRSKIKGSLENLPNMNKTCLLV